MCTTSYMYTSCLAADWSGMQSSYAGTSVSWSIMKCSCQQRANTMLVNIVNIYGTYNTWYAILRKRVLRMYTIIIGCRVWIVQLSVKWRGTMDLFITFTDLYEKIWVHVRMYSHILLSLSSLTPFLLSPSPHSPSFPPPSLPHLPVPLTPFPFSPSPPSLSPCPPSLPSPYLSLSLSLSLSHTQTRTRAHQCTPVNTTYNTRGDSHSNCYHQLHLRSPPKGPLTNSTSMRWPTVRKHCISHHLSRHVPWKFQPYLCEWPHNWLSQLTHTRPPLDASSILTQEAI